MLKRTELPINNHLGTVRAHGIMAYEKIWPANTPNIIG